MEENKGKMEENKGKMEENKGKMEENKGKMEAGKGLSKMEACKRLLGAFTASDAWKLMDGTEKPMEEGRYLRAVNNARKERQPSGVMRELSEEGWKYVYQILGETMLSPIITDNDDKLESYLFAEVTNRRLKRDITSIIWGDQRGEGIVALAKQKYMDGNWYGKESLYNAAPRSTGDVPHDLIETGDVLHDRIEADEVPHDRIEADEVPHDLIETGVIEHDCIMKFFANPDGLVRNSDGKGGMRVLEITCPLSGDMAAWIWEITDTESLKRVKPDLYWQMVADMSCTGAVDGDLVFCCGWSVVPMHVVHVERNEWDVLALEERVSAAVEWVRDVSRHFGYGTCQTTIRQIL